jgi:hypothetical protein
MALKIDYTHLKPYLISRERNPSFVIFTNFLRGLIVWAVKLDSPGT